jgi:type II secretory pathway component PulJ
MFTAIISQFEEHDRRIFWLFAAMLAVVLASYVYFLSISVYAVIARKHAEQETGLMNAKISQLESQYVALDKVIDLALARRQGFSEVTSPQYISQTAPKNSLTLRETIFAQ